MKKIIVNYCTADVYKDAYAEGGGRYVNTWYMENVGGKVYSDIDALIKSLSGWGFPEDRKLYSFCDGTVQSCIFVDADGCPASDYEIEAWKKGEKELYTASLCCGVELAEVEEMTEEYARSLGLEV